MTRGMPDSRGEKRSKPATVHMGPALKQVVEQMARNDNRTVSTFITQVLERDPLVKTVLQQIKGPGGN